MRFVFDFYNSVWVNLRVSIRRLGVDSVWYKTLEALVSVFSGYTTKANWIYAQIWLETATENGLDLWGLRYGIRRLTGESDNDFRNRIIQRKLINTTGIPISQKRQYIADVLGIDVSEVIIQNQTGNQSMAMGETIGSLVSSRNYTVYGYVIKIPAITDSGKRQRMVELISSTNIGGNYPVFSEYSGSYESLSMGGLMGGMIRPRIGYGDGNVYSIY